VFNFFIRQLAHNSGGDTGNKSSLWNRKPFFDNGTGSNERILSDNSAIKNNSSHPYESTISDLASMDDRPMSDRHIITHNNGMILRHMENASILNICPLPNLHTVNISSQHRLVPHTCMGRNENIADNNRTLGYKDGGVNFGTLLPVGNEAHGC
jgi:hypothetical protein